MAPVEEPSTVALVLMAQSLDVETSNITLIPFNKTNDL